MTEKDKRYYTLRELLEKMDRAARADKYTPPKYRKGVRKKGKT